MSFCMEIESRKVIGLATVAVYSTKRAKVLHIRVPKEIAQQAGFTNESRICASVQAARDSCGRSILAIVLVKADKGVKVSNRGTHFLIQLSNLLSFAMTATRVQVLRALPGKLVLIHRALPVVSVEANDNSPFAYHAGKDEHISSGQPGLKAPMLRSLTVDRGHKARVKYLSGNTERQTTKAGDECYTAGFIVEAARRAMEATSGQREFDIDVASMQPDGRYFEALTSISHAKWGDTPKRLQNLEEFLVPVAARNYFTNDRPFGSLRRDWKGRYIWMNPPYTSRSWAAFVEYAHHQVDCGNAGTVCALIPGSLLGEHVYHCYSPYAYSIEMIRQVPFLKREKPSPDGVLLDAIETIPSNRIVVLGKVPETRTFLSRLLEELASIGYITEGMRSRYHSLFQLTEIIDGEVGSDAARSVRRVTY